METKKNIYVGQTTNNSNEERAKQLKANKVGAHTRASYRLF